MKTIIKLLVITGLVKFADPKGVIDIKTLKKGLFRKDSNGTTYLAIAVHKFHKGDDLQGAVTPRSLDELDTLERKSIVLAADGKPAIKIAQIINDATDIEKFVVGLLKGTISTVNHTVLLEVANGTGIDAIIPEILISQGATISPRSQVEKDFSAGAVEYTVTAEDGTIQVWQITVRELTDILTFVLAEQTGAATINPVNHTIAIEVANATDVSALTPTITLPTASTVAPLSGVAQDFTNPKVYTVTNGETSQAWTVTVTEAGA